MKIAPLTLLPLLLASPARADFGFVLESRWSAGTETIRSLAFAPDGSWLAAAIEQQGVVFNLSNHPPNPGKLRGPRKETLGVAVSPDGRTIALVDAAGALHLYDSTSLASIAKIENAHSGKATTVSFTTDGIYVLSGGEDGKIKAWTPQGNFFAELSKGAKHEKGILFVGGVSSGRSAISVGRDRRIILWQVDTQQALRPTLVEMDVRSAAIGGKGLLVLGLQNLTGNLHWARAPRGGLSTRRAPEISTTQVQAQEVKATDRVRLIDAGNGTQVRELEGWDQTLDTVGVTPDGRFAAAGGSGRSVSIWDTATGQKITTIPDEAPLTAVAFSPDGKRMALGTSTGSVSLYRLAGVDPVPSPATPSRVIIIILEPSGLVEESDTRRGEIPKIRSTTLELRGQLKSEAPIKSLLVDGHEITSLQPDGSGNYFFKAYVPARQPGQRRFEIVAENTEGVVSRQSFVVERTAEASPPPLASGRRMALIVGISRYADPKINLEYASHDARALYQALTNQALGPAAFEPSDVLLLLDEQATAAAITTGLRDFLQKARENDFVLFFFAGHGAPDPNRLQDLYLLAHDTNPNNIAGTGLLMRHVREAIAEIPARDVLILSDACHSAGIASSPGRRSVTENPIHQVFLDKLLHASGGLAILTASEAAQVSFENARWDKHGVFTYFLLQGLRGAADEDHDGVITLGEIMEYVRDQVRSATRSQQIPAIGPTSFDRQMPLAIVASPSSPHQKQP